MALLLLNYWIRRSSIQDTSATEDLSRNPLESWYWIAPEERGRGVATMSIDAMIAVAKQCEVDVVELMANPIMKEVSAPSFQRLIDMVEYHQR